MLVYLLVRGSACAHRRLVQTLWPGGEIGKDEEGWFCEEGRKGIGGGVIVQ